MDKEKMSVSMQIVSIVWSHLRTVVTLLSVNVVRSTRRQ